MQLFVYIIESLRPEDIRNRKNLALGQVLAQSLDFMDIDCQYIYVNSKNEFVNAITSNLYETCLNKKSFPILHFSMHGNEHCIEFSNGEFITWAELRERLSFLIKLMSNDLIICMCTCYGFSGCRMAMNIDDEETFGILIGNDNQLGFNEGLIAYQTFYYQLLKGSTIPNSVEVMKIASTDNNFRYISGIDAKKGYLDYIRNQAYELAKIRIEQAKNQFSQMYFLGDFSNQ
ncbi:hypothetical protein [Nostoc favosum]|uniref:CHAT domain-containing protein n=1 Tax=Nostoc favosum CHAB5714 TaxID=2780399 RepID=A0ABS8ILK5_9NOSO|nr:hypothetical protein [Nostoc favosum]MCC5604701.1 hypothetical protein [Nostoc favosum CHAB5714]